MLLFAVAENGSSNVARAMVEKPGELSENPKMDLCRNLRPFFRRYSAFCGTSVGIEFELRRPEINLINYLFLTFCEATGECGGFRETQREHGGISGPGEGRRGGGGRGGREGEKWRKGEKGRRGEGREGEVGRGRVGGGGGGGWRWGGGGRGRGGGGREGGVLDILGRHGRISNIFGDQRKKAKKTNKLMWTLSKNGQKTSGLRSSFY